MVWLGLRFRCSVCVYMGIIATIVDIVSSNVFYNVTCTSETMLIMMNLGDIKPRPLVYLQNLKGYPGCEPQLKKNFLIFRLNLNDTAHCGVNKMLNKQTGHSVFYHRIVIEIPQKDLELLFAQCVIPGDFNMEFVRIDWQKESLPVKSYSKEEERALRDSWNLSHTDVVPYLHMSVRDKGSRLDTSTVVRPGSLLDLLIYLDKHSTDRYDLSLRYLTLTDDTRSQEEVIVMNGCSVDPFVVQVFPAEDGVLRSQFRAFTFQRSEFVIFLATVNVCFHKCVETECYGPADGSGRRKREIPRYLPHYKNELYEVEVSTFLRLQSDVEGDIIREDSTNETLDALYETVDYPSSEMEIVSGMKKLTNDFSTVLNVLCTLVVVRSFINIS